MSEARANNSDKKQTDAREGARLHDYDQILNAWYDEVSREVDEQGPATIGLFGGRDRKSVV